MLGLLNLSASNERLLHDSLKMLADTATVVRDSVYWATKQTPLGDIVDRICKLMDDNNTIIFWGGACLGAAINPTYYFTGFVTAYTIGMLVPPNSKATRNIDFTALRQIIKVIVFLISPLLGALTYFAAAFTPGFHTYRVYQGQYYCKHQGFEALAHELSLIPVEARRWNLDMIKV